MKETNGQARMLTTEEAAKEWGISKKAIYRLVRLGKLKPFIGLKSWRFYATDFNENVLERL